MLESTKGSIPRRRIAEDTGLGYEWINKLAQGHIEDPGIKRISALYEYLQRHQVDRFFDDRQRPEDQAL